jgi:hypothetical protein
MKFEVDESGSSINGDMNIVLYSIDLGSIGDIYMEKSWLIFFEFFTDPFSYFFPFSNESP